VFIPKAMIAREQQPILPQRPSAVECNRNASVL
jgi:hypothetical protein